MQAITEMLAALKNPPKTLNEQLETFRANSLIETSTRIAEWVQAREIDSPL
jgi:hypothetical protein